MIDPWTIIGWTLIVVCTLIVGIVGSIIGLVSGSIASDRYIAYQRHKQTRDTEPAKGQTWVEPDGTKFHVKNIYDTGRLGLEARGPWGTASWGESPETWRQRVANRKLWLQA